MAVCLSHYYILLLIIIIIFSVLVVSAPAFSLPLVSSSAGSLLVNFSSSVGGSLGYLFCLGYGGGSGHGHGSAHKLD